ncbi:myo-inosose-2 dehydratase [Commensalibacter oyaizuii]|uniref:Myo-inosose-2 dehydratase n=1 Tax=Commensalibacter oyaizuii TaxID=3043873 RepID=A0ABT6Q3X6_9PROT|nr:myo-inosose-2 dehydratase [Commensalibacter sp. TBRC 16381]MDI2091834.1 myo-inosose-2 dehydratase [Commensalibacter sp. TBRC 16381]
MQHNSIKLGISPLSWVNEVLDDLGKDTTAEQCLSEIQYAGYAGVELSKIFPSDANVLTSLLNRYNLQLASGWYSGFLANRDVSQEIEAVTAHAQLLASCGSRILVYGECGHMTDDALNVQMSHRLTLSVDQWRNYGQRLSHFAEILYERFGLKLAYHHHLMMVAQQLDEVRHLMAVTKPAVGLLLDTGHAYAAGFDYQILITEFGDRICHIHLKDVRNSIMQQVYTQGLGFNDGVRRGMFTVPGDGDVSYDALAQFVQSGQYSGWMIVEAEQDPKKANPLKMAKSAYHYVYEKILNKPINVTGQ